MFKHLNVLEKDYFGLRYIDRDSQSVWYSQFIGLCQVRIKWMKVLLKCHFPSFCMLLFFLRIHSLYILINEGILENSCVLLGSKLFCSKFDKKSTPPSIEIFLVLCLFRRRAYFQGFVRYGKFILSYHVLFPYLFTLICCSFMLHSDWPKSDSSVDG